MDFPIITCFYEILRLTNTGLMYDLQILFDFRLSSLLDKRNWTEFTLNETEIHTALVVNFVVLVAMWLIISFCTERKRFTAALTKRKTKASQEGPKEIILGAHFHKFSVFNDYGNCILIIKSDCLNDISGIWTYGQGDGST